MKHKANILTLVVMSVLIGACLVTAALSLRAEPYMAVRTGFKCSQCHVNRTGGGKRTAFGMVYSQTTLPMTYVKSNGGPVFQDGKLSDFVSIGGNYRLDNETLVKYRSPSGDSAVATNQLLTSEANAYLQFDLIPGKFMFYLDQTITPLNSNREIFGLLEGLPGNGYFKFGRMLLPYGLRLLDDEAFIRNRTGFTYDRHDKGIELGFEPGKYSLVGNYTNTQLSFVGSVVHSGWRLGGSYARNTTRGGQHVFGVFGGATRGKFTALSEFDFITDGDKKKYASMVELSILVRKGVNLKTVYEFWDGDRSIPNRLDGRSRITLGLEPFVMQFFQVGLFYRINSFIPQNLPQNQNQLVLQFHVFF